MYLPNTYNFYWNTSAEDFRDRMYLEYKKEIIPKALILETMIPEDMVIRLNELLDKVSEDKKYKFEHNAAPTLAGVIKKGFQVYLEQKESIIQEYTNLTHELSKNIFKSFLFYHKIIILIK